MLCLALAAGSGGAGATAPGMTASPIPSAAQEVVSPEALAAAIDRLGDLDYPTRMNASRTVRRAPVERAVPALIAAVETHGDGYVRFRALVLLAGFNDPRARDVMRLALDDPNDRLREVSYAYFEEHPVPGMADLLLPRLEREESEFVRPRLIRALAALGTDARVRRALLVEVNRGEDFFRSAVIEALGEHRASYAVPALTTIANREGPLQDDAILALGRIGDARSLATLASLQRSASQPVQAALAGAICLLGSNCDSHQRFLIETLDFASRNPGYQSLVRAAATALAAVALSGRLEAFDTLVERGVPARDPERAPLALAVGSIALRDPSLLLSALERQADPSGTVDLLRDAFDMLEEDFAEERFFATMRRAYWRAADDSPAKQVTTMLIERLEF